jgi:hypothetical protein
MQFTEENALIIVEKFNLNKSTIAVWRTRNKIPDKYSDPNFLPRIAITDRIDLLKSERVKSVLKMKEINTPVMQGLINAPISDIIADKSTFTKEELTLSAKEINRIKIDVVKMIDKNNQVLLKKLLADERLKYYTILRATLSDNDIKSVYFSLNKGAGIDTYTYNRIKDAYAKFAIQLNL